VKVHGETLLVGYSKSAVLAWNPPASLDPVNSYEVGDPDGINSVSHLAGPDGLHTYVLTRHTLDHLVDFVRQGEIAFRRFNSLADITALPGHQLLCRDSTTSLVRLVPWAEPTTVLEAEQLLRHLKRHHAIANNERISIAGLGVAEIGRRTFVTALIYVSRWEPDGYIFESGSLICALNADKLRPIAFFRVPAEGSYCTRLQDLGDGSFRILCGIEPERTGARPMVFWSTPYSSKADFVLAVAGSAVSTEAFWAAVSWLDLSSALAGTGGTLWSIDIESGTSSIIDEGNGGPILAIDILDW